MYRQCLMWIHYDSSIINQAYTHGTEYELIPNGH